jgi:Txe/YoeB family toxin of Txe-Axe toxin-antitoxin module
MSYVSEFLSRLLSHHVFIILYGCETWSRTLREEHRLRVFENRVLIRIFGPKKGKVMGCWRRVNEELHNLYASLLE